MAQPATAVETSLADRYRDEIEHLIGEDLVQDALDKLQDFVRDLAPAMKNDALLMRRSFSNYTRDVRRGLARREDVVPLVARILELTTDIHAAASVDGKFRLGAGPVPAPGPVPMPTMPAPPVMTLISPPPNAPPTGSLHPLPPPSPANDTGGRFDSLDDVKRFYWEEYRRSRPPSDSVAFACENISKSYRAGGFKLDPISFQLRVGEITGVVGRNASGKTTLLRIVLGDLLQDSGTTAYPLLTRDKSGWAHIKRQIADIPQFPEKWPGRLRPNLNYVAAVHGIRGKRNTELVDWHVERYGLSEYEDATWNQISGGYKIRFELVRALVSKPKLLVLDEPLAYLDVMARQEFLKNLRAIAASFEEPVPIIITSQHLYEIEAVADQMILLDDGRCVYAGPLGAVGASVQHRKLEISLKVPQPQMLAALAAFDVKSVEATMEGYILGFPKELAANQVYHALYGSFGERLLDFRDITGSARSLFEEKTTSRSAKRGE